MFLQLFLVSIAMVFVGGIGIFYFWARLFAQDLPLTPGRLCLAMCAYALVFAGTLSTLTVVVLRLFGYLA